MKLPPSIGFKTNRYFYVMNTKIVGCFQKRKSSDVFSTRSLLNHSPLDLSSCKTSNRFQLRRQVFFAKHFTQLRGVNSMELITAHSWTRASHADTRRLEASPGVSLYIVIILVIILSTRSIARTGYVQRQQSSNWLNHSMTAVLKQAEPLNDSSPLTG